MDIATHAGIGVIAAAPFIAERLEPGLGLVAGSVLPDLDAFCRLVVSTTTEGNSTHLLCRDMRTRNFGTRYGDLEVWLAADHKVTRSAFHV